ncbi:MAG TPA: hypothetical protein PKE47_06715 [Verrucomicrobiota bacterium]|nr:hypothetical protein [Verrucomicrobiota bacterium]
MNIRLLAAPLAAAAALFLAGCGKHDHASHGHGAGGGHSHDSLQGGVAVELGDHQFHLDVLAVPEAGQLKAFIMDAHVENFVRVPLKSFDMTVEPAGGTPRTLTLEAQANAASGETIGDTSAFLGTAEWLKGVTNFTAILPQLEIRGQTFRGVVIRYP